MTQITLIYLLGEPPTHVFKSIRDVNLRLYRVHSCTYHQKVNSYKKVYIY